MTRLDIGAKKDIGRVRENQEDELGIWEGKDLVVLVVADGMGGLALGEVASKIAVETILDFCKKGKIETAKDLEWAIRAANKKIGEETNWAAGTTICAGLIKNRKLWVLNVGDSRAYLIRENTIEQVTVDHRHFLFKNIVTRSLGNQPEVEVDIFEHKLKKRDFLLLCTDGLSDLVSEDKIKRIILSVKNPKLAADDLVASANAAGGFDNITTIVARVLS